MARAPKTALITGSGKNIGRASALALAAEGLNVIVNGSRDRESCETVASEVQALGVDAHVIMCDVGDPVAVRAMADEAISMFGTVDVLVNNAAVRPNMSFLEADDAEWERVLSIDFHSSRRLAQVCIPGMLERGWGRIINFAGMNAIAGYDGKAPVSAAKHASWGVTKCLAKEFGPHGITVNIISPGPIAEETGEQPEKKQKMIAGVPAGRMGVPAEVAAMVRLLASDDGAYINGQLLHVNGGGSM